MRQRCAEEYSQQHAAHSCGAAYSGLVGIVLVNRIFNLFGVDSFNGVCGHFVALLLPPRSPELESMPSLVGDSSATTRQAATDS